MGVSRALRFEILRRDHHTCTYCGAKAPDVKLHVDHIVPESLGGADHPSNLTTACQDCNAGKSGRMIDETVIEPVDKRAARWVAAMEQAISERRADVEVIRKVGEYFLTNYWQAWEPVAEIEDDYPETIVRFLRTGLDWDTIEELVDVAMKSQAKSKWKYFCGCCNRRLDDLRARALEIVEADHGA